jgi:hypothetical protein
VGREEGARVVQEQKTTDAVGLCVLDFIAVAAVLAVAVAWGIEGSRRWAAPRVLERWAKARGLRFAPAPKSGPVGACAFGRNEDLAFVVALSKARTSVCVDVLRGRAPTLHVAQRSALARWMGGEHDAVGGAFVVAGVPVDEAKLLFSSHLSALRRLDRRSDVKLVSDRGRVTIRWNGLETDPSVLDAALRLAMSVGNHALADAPYR